MNNKTDKRNAKGGFYMLSRRLFVPECPLSLEAKVLVIIINDRLAVSEKNHWRDKRGELYCYLSVKEAAAMLGRCESKTRRVFSELEKFGYITKQRQGQGRPNRLYMTPMAAEYLDPVPVQPLLSTPSFAALSYPW